jgi:hypothetical protein
MATGPCNRASYRDEDRRVIHHGTTAEKRITPAFRLTRVY